MPLLSDAAQDLRFALRSCRRSPGFTLTALLAISLGIGAATAVFSVVDPILFRALPYRDATRLVSLGMLAPAAVDDEFLFATHYRALTLSANPFSSTATWSGVSDCDLTSGSAQRVQCAEVDAHFLPTLGIHPLLGQPFT